MHPQLRQFLARWLGLVALSLVPVILTAFVTLPLSLYRHPAEPVAQGQPARHMT